MGEKDLREPAQYRRRQPAATDPRITAERPLEFYAYGLGEVRPDSLPKRQSGILERFREWGLRR